MEWINLICNNDSVIYDISIKDSCLIVYIKLWNNLEKQVIFRNYHIFKEKNAINEEIGDVKVQDRSKLIEELEEDVLNGGRTSDEVANIKSILFYNSWNDRILLEVLGEEIDFK